MKWSLAGHILELVQSSDLEVRAFAIQLNNGQVIWRSSQFIRLNLTKATETEKDQTNKKIIKSIHTINSW